GKLTRQHGEAPEDVASVWLRFNPAEVNKIFPPDTVSAATTTSVISQMRMIAGAKFRASYHAGMNAMIPDPKDMTVDVDTKASVRRFFMVDKQAVTAQYVSAFERQAVRLIAAAHTRSEAPKILFTKPADGATDVDPELREITVTFDQDMGEGCSWTGSGPEFPASPEGEKVQWRGKRTCVLPVKLEPKHHYRVGINAPSFRNFRSAAGNSVEPASVSFMTK
ncbi:MAG TPA: Ig-like domain-containing protein, partial [Patescibacteria group bacterium]|nr:Ig-like domain-containing protein [Patescibacteria group bacterium]